MAFCIQCGSNLEDSCSFCEHCGAPVERNAVPTNTVPLNTVPLNAVPTNTVPLNTVPLNAVPTNAIPLNTVPTNTVPTNTIPTNTIPINVSPAPTIPTKQKRKVSKKTIIISVVVAVILILSSAIGTFCYFELNKVQLPNALEFKHKSIASIENNLKSQGLNVHIEEEFNRLARGKFIKIKGAEPGSSVSRFTPITIVASAGPGVPSNGVVGAKLESAKNILKNMGVEVKVHNVIADNKPSGEVIGTEPMPGYSVINGYKGVIHVAVATKGDGIPVDLFGMDKNKAEEKLKSLGFTDISLKPHFASKKMIGKVMGSNPSLGSRVTGGHVDLLYGVDAAGARDAIATNDKGKSLEYKKGDSKLQFISYIEPLLGTWCTKSGDCINLQYAIIPNPENITGESRIYTVNGHPSEEDYSSKDDRIYNSYAPNTLEISMDNIQQMLLDIVSSISVTSGKKLDPHMKDIMKNHLISGDTGAVEIYQSLGMPYCGKDLFVFPMSTQKVCEAGHLKNYDGNALSLFMDLHNHKKFTGMSYKMSDFFVAIPVNAKLDELEKNGYFRGKGKKQPDLNRPFILRRNPNLYKSTSVPYDGEYSTSDNPFVPTSKHKPVPFAPAPDDSNAYYLVEQPFDWNTIK